MDQTSRCVHVLLEAVEIRMGQQPVKAKWVKVELRKIETIPYGSRGEEFVDLVGQNPVAVWEAREDHDALTNVRYLLSVGCSILMRFRMIFLSLFASQRRSHLALLWREALALK
jgi:hypothetical protein